MAIIGWVETETITERWADAPADPMLSSLLGAAYEQCLAYLPHVRNEDGDLEPVIPSEPRRLELAQLMQARALYRAQTAGRDDAYGAEGMTVTVFPMDWQVKNLLRPKAVGRVL